MNDQSTQPNVILQHKLKLSLPTDELVIAFKNAVEEYPAICQVIEQQVKGTENIGLDIDNVDTSLSIAQQELEERYRVDNDDITNCTKKKLIYNNPTDFFTDFQIHTKFLQERVEEEMKTHGKEKGRALNLAKMGERWHKETKEKLVKLREELSNSTDDKKIKKLNEKITEVETSKINKFMEEEIEETIFPQLKRADCVLKDINRLKKWVIAFDEAWDKYKKMR